ncbi:hypothetical protein [Halostagnicola sp. A-GB9-2]|uniref:hypothetical protein n=1 Tax=Halostagnicola sp. A-GB9-2 TaxID=3048066 RepID=UPI0024C0882E|nr:hypothetical protein [Halostagnicola sp. A-GB9-2]MDJ1430810.1 hypothetical protein [Halostagnicola sp. A-GB9-2]
MSLGSSITAIGFWVGALLPLFYIPVFIAGVDSVGRLLLLVAFIAVNVLALWIGHDYAGSRDD